MNRHLYPQIRTIHVLSVIAVFAISAGILLAAQSGCIGATLAGTDGSYDTPDTGLSEHAPVQAVTAWEGMSNLIVACQIADTFADMLFTGVLDAAYAVHAVLSLTAVDNITDTPSLELDGAVDITTFVVRRPHLRSQLQQVLITAFKYWMSPTHPTSPPPATSPPQAASQMTTAWCLMVHEASPHSSQAATHTPQLQHMIDERRPDTGCHRPIQHHRRRQHHIQRQHRPCA